MLIRVVQFSDLHVKSGKEASYLDATKVVDAVRAIGEADAYIIVVSGDLAFSGKKEEYDIVSTFMKTFFSNKGFERKKNHIEFFYAPGNHDIDFSSGRIAKDSEDFKNKYGDSIRSNKLDINKISAEYHDAMSAFFSFAKLGNCEWSDRTIYQKTIVIDGFKLVFTLLNSAAFSLLGGDGEDKGCHRITKRYLEILRNTPDADFNCLVMHHGIEWHTDDTKKSLREILASKYDVLLTGHEHDEVTENRIINDGEPCYYIQSNAFNDSTLKENGFCVIDIDSITKQINVYSFVQKGDIYIHLKIGNTSIRKHAVNGIRNNEEFNKLLTLDQYGIPYESYYYFPMLEYRYFDDENNPVLHTIQTENELMEFLTDKRKVSISGENKAGKTLLAKRIYQKMIERKIIPILFDTDIRDIKKERIIESTFNNQYRTENNSYERFLQLPKEKRVAIIDDAELIKAKSYNLLMSHFSETFGSIIIFHKAKLPTDLHRQVLDVIDDNHRLMISPFLYSSRKGLITKVLSIKGLTPEEVESKSNQINDLINKQIKYFYLNPEFIIDFVNLYEEDSKFKKASGKSAFSMVYENTLKNRIIKNCQSGSPDKVFNILQEIAYHMHFKRKKSITVGELNEHIEKYKRDYRQDISFVSFIETSKKSGIIKEHNNQFSFRDRTHLAYFVARAINQKAMDPSDPEYLEAENNFSYLLDTLCFGINSDIVLFLAVVTNNMRFINIVIKKAEDFYFNKEELNFSKNNVPFINKTNLKIENNLPGNEERKKRDENISKSERNIKDLEVIEVVNEYDYSDDDVDLYANQLLVALKYLEIISNTLPAFSLNMKSAQQDRLVELVYKCPNKFLFMVLKNINDNLDEFIEGVYQEISQKNKNGKDIDKDSIRAITEQISTILVIAIYQLVTSTNATNDTIQALNAFREINLNSNYSILNFMFNARLCDIEKLAEDSISLDRKLKLPIERSMILYAVRDYYMRNNVKQYGAGARVSDYFFGRSKARRKETQLKSIKKRLTE